MNLSYVMQRVLCVLLSCCQPTLTVICVIAGESREGRLGIGGTPAEARQCQTAGGIANCRGTATEIHRVVL